MRCSCISGCRGEYLLLTCTARVFFSLCLTFRLGENSWTVRRVLKRLRSVSPATTLHTHHQHPVPRKQDSFQNKCSISIRSSARLCLADVDFLGLTSSRLFGYDGEPVTRYTPSHTQPRITFGDQSDWQVGHGPCEDLSPRHCSSRCPSICNFPAVLWAKRLVHPTWFHLPLHSSLLVCIFYLYTALYQAETCSVESPSNTENAERRRPACTALVSLLA